VEFGLESLRDLPDIEALKHAGLMGAEVSPNERDAAAHDHQAGVSPRGSEALRVRVAKRHDLAKVGLDPWVQAMFQELEQTV